VRACVRVCVRMCARMTDFAQFNEHVICSSDLRVRIRLEL